jgi:hypothetical protein
MCYHMQDEDTNNYVIILKGIGQYVPEGRPTLKEKIMCYFG